MTGHESLGEALAGLQLRGCLGGSKDRNAAPAKFIDGAEHQRNLRADDDEVRAGIHRRFDDGVFQAVEIAGQAGCLLGNAGVAGS